MSRRLTVPGIEWTVLSFLLNVTPTTPRESGLMMQSPDVLNDSRSTASTFVLSEESPTRTTGVPDPRASPSPESIDDDQGLVATLSDAEALNDTQPEMDAVTSMIYGETMRIVGSFGALMRFMLYASIPAKSSVEGLLLPVSMQPESSPHDDDDDGGGGGGCTVGQ